MRKHILAMIMIMILVIPTINTKQTASFIEKSSIKHLAQKNISMLNKTVSGVSYRVLGSNDKNFDFISLLKYIRGLKGNLSEFPLRNTEDGYINATYYGVLSLYFLGVIEEVEGNNRLSSYLRYLYDEDNGGFRDWLGGNVSLVSTAYAIFTMNLTNQHFPGFNATKTANFILSRFSDGGFIDINRENPDPYTTAMAIIALKYIENHVNKSLLIREIDYDASAKYLIDHFDKQVGFYDESINIPAPVQNYWVLKALIAIDKESILNLKSDLENVFLSYLYRGSNKYLLGGFGDKNNAPTVFQTGLSLEALSIIGYSNKTLYNESIWFINNSQADTGEVHYNPRSLEGDIFQAAGSILGFYAANKLANIIKIEHYVIPSEQIPIDYDNLQVKIKLEINNNDLDYLNITYQVQEMDINGSMYFDGLSYYVMNLLPRMLGFGNFTVEFEMYPRGIVFTVPLISYELSFRVGYKLVTEINATQLKPAETLSLKVNVTFEKNDTIVSNGQLIINITNSEGTLITNKIFSLNGLEINYVWSIPSNFILGRYSILIYVNDTHGYNHTIKIIDLSIVDELNITFTKNLSSIYYIGETINASAIIHYNYSGALVPAVPDVHLVMRNGTYSLLDTEINWFKDGVINITVEIPSVIPRINNLTIYMEFNWPGEFKQLYLVRNITISIGSLIIGKLENLKKTYFYGDNITLSMEIIAEKTNASVQNATLIANIVNASESILQVLHAKYNYTLSRYEINSMVDPNIPQGTYSLVFKAYIPFNKSYVNLKTDKELEITINGTLTGKVIEMKGSFIEGEVIEFVFNVSCKENGKLVSGLLLISNATSKNFNASSIATDIGHGTYLVGFSTLKAGKYQIAIYRLSDKELILSFDVSIKKKETEAAAFFELYGPAISIGIIILLITAYIFTYWWFGSKISKRYLIRKLRRK